MLNLCFILLLNSVVVYTTKDDKTKLGRTVFYLNLVSALFTAIQIYVSVSH